MGGDSAANERSSDKKRRFPEVPLWRKPSRILLSGGLAGLDASVLTCHLLVAAAMVGFCGGDALNPPLGIGDYSADRPAPRTVIPSRTFSN